MTARSAGRRSSLLADVSEPRLYIFVPALMSVGFLFWFSALLRDRFDRRRVRAIDRRSVAAGRAAAAIVRGDPLTRTPDHPAPDRRRLNVLVAVLFSALSAYVVIGAIGNYARRGGYVHDIGWVLALSILLAASFAAIGFAFGIVGIQSPDLSPLARRIVARTPVEVEAEPEAVGGRPLERLTIALLITAGAAALISMAVGSSRGFLSRFDEPVLEAATDMGWIGAMSRVDLLGTSLFAVLAAALLGLASARCRVLLAAYPVALISGLVVSNLLKVLIERERPPDGPMAERFDSFPSGHVNMTTILAGLLPLTLAVMAHSTRFVRPARLVAAVAVAIGATHRVYNETHWPTDVLGAILIGGSIVLGVEWAIAHGTWHRRCATCPWAPERIVGAVGHGTVPMRLDTAKVLGWLSHLAAAAVAVGLAVLSFTRGLPVDPEGILLDRAVQQPLQLGLAGVVSVAALISWRWPPVGAALLALAGVGLSTLASLQYEPAIAFAMAAFVLTPAVLLWLSWQHRRRPGEIGLLAVVTAALLLASWLGASAVYGSVFGPTHPASAAKVVATDHVEWVWTGGLGPTSVVAVVRLDDDDRRVRLIATADGRTWASPPRAPTEADLVRLELTGLTPDRQYEFVVEVGGEPDAGRGRGTFRTPAVGAASFRLVASSCARVGSNGAVFDAMAAEEPLLFLNLGDAHYSNIAANDVSRFHAAYDRMLTQPGPAALYRNVPVSYVWDDHDYGPNDADASSPSRDAARQAFREAVPSHPLVSEGAIYRAYTIGRVRFVVTDTRSERRAGSMLGPEQLAWLEDELVTASRTHALIIWLNPSPWIGEASPSGDGWSGFAEERRHIADALAAGEVDNLLMVSGDAHMLAFDDGTNSGYASDEMSGFPVFQTAALDRPGSIKGGPYSGGAFPGSGQYGVIDIRDDGKVLEVELTGKNWKGDVLLTADLRFSG